MLLVTIVQFEHVVKLLWCDPGVRAVVMRAQDLIITSWNMGSSSWDSPVWFVPLVVVGVVVVF